MVSCEKFIIILTKVMIVFVSFKQKQKIVANSVGLAYAFSFDSCVFSSMKDGQVFRYELIVTVVTLKRHISRIVAFLSFVS
jgi:hypothetical protein